MAPDISVMRQYVSDMYPGPRWKYRVRHMPDNQVTAIYFREIQKEETKPKESKDDEEDIPF